MRNILVSAYACEPLKGSETAVGWNWVLQLARRNKVYVITRSNNREVIEAHLPAAVAANIRFYYYDCPAAIRRLKHRDKGLYFYNFCWQIGIMPIARRIAREVGLDYTMHLTFGSMWMPTFLPLLRVPFIWGPIGGGECVPKSFLGVLPWRQRVVQRFRYLLNATTALNPFVMLPALRAKAVIARTALTRDILPAAARRKTRVLLETAMDEDVFRRCKRDYHADVVRLIVCARFISIKNIPTVVRALRHIKAVTPWRLTLVGSGPDEGLIRREVAASGCDNVEMVPFLPREEALQAMLASDIFVFPSLKEGGTWALMEAMAMALPVVCVNWAGMAVETDAQTAVQIPVTCPRQMELDMAAALTRLIDSEQERQRLGQAARERIRTVFNWEAKGAFMERLFAELESGERE